MSDQPIPETNNCAADCQSQSVYQQRDAFHKLARKLERQRDEARRERDLAIAHDSQPYPTAEAYERICKCHEALRAELDEARETIRLQHELMKTAEQRGMEKVSAELDTVKKERDEALAINNTLRALPHGAQTYRKELRNTRKKWQEALDERDAAIARVKELSAELKNCVEIIDELHADSVPGSARAVLERTKEKP